MKNLVLLIRNSVIPKTKPAVYTSGGLDSTIVLHHLREKYNGEIYTYTAKFNTSEDEHEKAKVVAEYYKTIHREIEINNFIGTLPKIMKFFEQPRYNVWPYWLARQAKLDGRKTVYIGEGSDELFGGYLHRGYLEAWAIHLMFVRHTYETIHNHLGLDLQIPFGSLDWKKVIEYYSPPKKKILREAYKNILPDFALDIKSSQPPAFTGNYWKLWNAEIYKYFPDYKPNSISDIRKALQFLVTKLWLTHKNDLFKMQEEL